MSLADDYDYDLDYWTCPNCGAENAETRLWCWQCDSVRPKDEKAEAPHD